MNDFWIFNNKRQTEHYEYFQCKFGWVQEYDFQLEKDFISVFMGDQFHCTKLVGFFFIKSEIKDCFCRTVEWQKLHGRNIGGHIEKDICFEKLHLISKVKFSLSKIIDLIAFILVTCAFLPFLISTIPKNIKT